VGVSFKLKKRCEFGETFAIVGSAPVMGEWHTFDAMPLAVSGDPVFIASHFSDVAVAGWGWPAIDAVQYQC